VFFDADLDGLVRPNALVRVRKPWPHSARTRPICAETALRQSLPQSRTAV